MQLLTDFIKPGNVYFRNKVYGPDEILAGINSVAKYLGDNLVSKSPFIYLFATNHVKTVCAYFGIIKAHKICVLMDPKIGRLELAEKLLDTPPAACIRIISETESFDFSREFEIREQPWKDGEEDLSDVCTMIYTAADDGYAKAAMLTHENILSNARGIIDWDKVSGATISCALIAYNHLFALQTGVIAPMLDHGGIFIEEVGDWKTLSSLAENISRVKVTNFYSVPVVYFLLSKVAGIKKKIESIEYFVSGGYKLSETIYQRFLKHSGREINEGYGLTEASPICSCHQRGAPINIKSVGTPFYDCEIAIKQNGNFQTQNNQEGEICVRGANLMKGYYHFPEVTRKVLNDGWLSTGDLGYKDKDNLIYLTGAIKRMINYGGKKVYPSEVERFIGKNQNVVESKIYGKENKLYCQAVYARIRLKENNHEARKNFTGWCSENIAEYKNPVKIEFV